ncbi:MAG: L-seryl-tRNA(Sec) selenium transferase [Dehalococcoidia bacterium]|nr:L-seryl-tRNA(Sec) selenium transferase [Dehalococcoidia bacterium]
MKSSHAVSSTQLQNNLHQLPSVEILLQHPSLAPHISFYSRPLVTEAVRQVLSEQRNRLRSKVFTLSTEEILLLVIRRLSIEWPGFSQPVINATGIILHTNLGRAPLSSPSLEAVKKLGGRYYNLESDLAKGNRGKRTSHLRRILAKICGAEDAIVVNNNAAAMLLVLVALANGQEALVSRGELVQIGGGFRIPEILEQSGVILHEVGSTNHTSLADYSKAINEHCGMIIKVNQSNFVQKGFVSQASISDLSNLAQKSNLPLVYDLGSGVLLDTAAFGLEHEKTVMEALQEGADVVCFSGDKLLGGPQAGIIVGKTKYLSVLEKHPLMRVVRLDKLSAIALEATIKSYLNGDSASIPLWQLLSLKTKSLRTRALAIARHLKKHGVPTIVTDGVSMIGGGTMPEQSLPSVLLCLQPLCGSVENISRQLRLSSPPLLTRTEKNSVILDMRTIFPDQDSLLPNIISAAWNTEV